jgi:hypothetical protein
MWLAWSAAAQQQPMHAQLAMSCIRLIQLLCIKHSVPAAAIVSMYVSSVVVADAADVVVFTSPLMNTSC